MAQAEGADTKLNSMRARLEQAEATIQAIYTGEVDAVVVNGPNGPQVYTLEGADHPYRVLVEQMHEGTVTLDDNGVILYANRQFGWITGAERDTLTGSNFERYLAPGSRDVFAELSEAASLAGHSCADLNLRSVAGELVPARLSLTAIDMPGMRAVCVVVSDLREARRNEGILKEEQLSRQILDQAGEAVVVIDTAGVILRRSLSANALSGHALLLNRFDDVFPLQAGTENLDAQRILQKAAGGGRLRGMEATLAAQNGREYSLLISAGPLWDGAGELLGCVITLTDITERKRSEEAMARQAEELLQVNSDLRQFAHSASHDLREPVRQLAVFSELLEKRYREQLDDEAMRLIRQNVASAHRIEALLAGLLEYIQASSGPKARNAKCDANEVARRTIETFEAQIAETGGRVHVDALPVLPVHEVHLTQVFQNLVGNALKYRSEEPPLVHIGAEAVDGVWRISVTDNGIGIQPDYREKVFELFQRLHGGGKFEGNGLGLAICQKIVQRYGGRIWVEAGEDRGSRFVFTIPRGGAA